MSKEVFCYGPTGEDTKPVLVKESPDGVICIEQCWLDFCLKGGRSPGDIQCKPHFQPKNPKNKKG